MKEVKRPVVSVVVPVYNTEPFLAECLHSLEKQTLTDIEIILVNDGSTDNSGRLLREYADKDARFVYVEQENQGLSAARNTGMEHASGHYLAFLDSDDWLAENALQVLCAIAAKTRTDIVSGNTLAVHADGQVQSWERRAESCLLTGTVVSGSTYFSRVMVADVMSLWCTTIYIGGILLNRMDFALNRGWFMKMNYGLLRC